MTTPKKRGGRPPEPSSKKRAIMIRLDDADWIRFEKLVEARNADLQAENVKVKGPDVIRWLIVKEFSSRGLDETKESR